MYTTGNRDRYRFANHLDTYARSSGTTLLRAVQANEPGALCQRP
jgi:hypothetical protein